MELLILIFVLIVFGAAFDIFAANPSLIAICACAIAATKIVPKVFNTLMLMQQEKNRAIEAKLKLEIKAIEAKSKSDLKLLRQPLE